MKKILSICLVVLMLTIICIPTAVVHAVNTAYYVDSVNGNDSNDGKSTANAWKTLAKVNATTFQSGDQILFKAGCSWTGMLHPLGSGSSSGQITIDMYGTGTKPLIAGNGNTAGVMLDGQEYWTIKNLQVTNTAATRAIRHGIFVYAKASGITNNIFIQNCEVHDVTGENRRSLADYVNMYWNSGIYLSLPGRSTATTHFNNVLVESNYVHDVLTSGIRIAQREDFIIDPYHTNVIIRNNTISKTGTDGMIVANCASPLIENNLCYDAGYNGNQTDTKLIAGLWACGASNAVFQYNEVARTKLFDSDGTAFDTDWGTGGTTIFQYNYTHGNEGGFWLDCAGINKDATHVKTICRYNVSVNDLGYITRNGDMPADIYNNVFYKSSGALDSDFNSSGTQHKFWNNIFYFQTNPNWASSSYTNNLYFPCSVNATDVNAVRANPKFVNAGAVGDGISYADNYKITAGSPCIDKGISVAANGGKDYWGNTLYTGLADIGAHEYGTSPIYDANTYKLSSDFSLTQGARNWYYMQASGGTYSNMTWNAAKQWWVGSYTYNLIWNPTQIHPDGNDSVVAWKAPKTGTVTVVGNPKKRNSGGDGVNVKIIKNTTQAWPSSGWQAIGASDTTGITHNITLNVTQNEMIYFIVNKGTTNNNDEVTWDPTITYSNTLKNDFSTIQGTRNWYYMQLNGSTYSNMTWDSTQNKWKGAYTYNLIWSPAQMHPDTNDSVIAWKAPQNGNVKITGNPRKIGVGYDGVNVKIMKNGTQIWPTSGWQFIANDDLNGVLHNVTADVATNDYIYFILNKVNNNYSDEINWNPSVSYN